MTDLFDSLSTWGASVLFVAVTGGIAFGAFRAWCAHKRRA